MASGNSTTHTSIDQAGVNHCDECAKQAMEYEAKPDPEKLGVPQRMSMHCVNKLANANVPAGQHEQPCAKVKELYKDASAGTSIAKAQEFCSIVSGCPKDIFAAAEKKK